MPLRSSCRVVGRAFSVLPVINGSRSNYGVPSSAWSTTAARCFTGSITGVKFTAFKMHDVSMRHEIYRRRLKIGPEVLRHRNIWQNWDYDAEIYTFGARLGEKFSAETLRLAFMHPSYIEQEAIRRREAMIFDTVDFASVYDQSPLRKLGVEIMEGYIPPYVRLNFPYFPEEGVRAVTRYLSSENVLATISFHLGTSDLIMCADLPPQRKTLSDTLLAVIGALAKDAGTERAEHFILDFILTEMSGKDINDFLTLKLSNPMGVLIDILKREARPEPESRLIRSTGSTTLMAAYVVGIYSDQKCIGESFGESLLIAEEMAARDALRRFFETDLCQRPWLFGDAGKSLDLSGYHEPNVSLLQWSRTACEEGLRLKKSRPIVSSKNRAALQ